VTNGLSCQQVFFKKVGQENPKKKEARNDEHAPLVKLMITRFLHPKNARCTVCAKGATRPSAFGAGKWLLLLKVPKLVEHLLPIYGIEVNCKAADFYFYLETQFSKWPTCIFLVNVKPSSTKITV